MDWKEAILEVLKENSSSQNKMSAAAVRKELDKNYKNEKVPEIQTVRKKLQELVGYNKSDYSKGKWEPGTIELGIGKQVHAILYGNPEHQQLKDFWYVNDIDISTEELKYLVDLVLYSKILTTEEAKRIVKKIINLADKQLKDFTVYRDDINELPYIGVTDVLKNVYILQKAIKDRKKVRFMLNIYAYKNININKQETQISISPCWACKRVVSPYQIVMNNGRYYLCAADVNMNRNRPVGEKELTYKLYRVDLMTRLEVLNNEKAMSRDVGGAPELQSISEYVIQTPHMFTGNVEDVIFEFNRDYFTQIVDWFGKKFVVEKEDLDANTITIKVRVNTTAMLYWVLQYNEYIKVIKPEALRKEVIKKLTNTLNKYNE